MLCRRPSLATSARTALILAAIGGCGSDSKSAPSPTFEADPSEVQSALTNPITDCQQTQAQCLLTAAGDPTASQACVAALPTCLQNAATAGATIQQSLLKCQDDAQKCALGGGKLNDCQSTFEACSQSALGGGASDAGVSAPTSPTVPTIPTLPSGPSVLDGGIALPTQPTPGTGIGQQLPGSNGGAQLPTLPGLPSIFPKLDAGGLSLLPPGQKCLFDLNQCIAADPTQANKCGDDAKTCLATP